MPIGTVDYRERLRGPGTQDVLGMLLRGIAGGSAPSAEPALDPEGAQAVKDMFGGSTPPAPRPLRPDEQAALADRKAREAHRQIVAPQSMAGGGAATSDPSMPGQLANIEMLKALGVKPGIGRLSTNVEDRRGKPPTEMEDLYRKITDSAVNAGLTPGQAEEVLQATQIDAGSEAEMHTRLKRIWERIQSTGAQQYWNPEPIAAIPKSRPVSAAKPKRNYIQLGVRG